MAVKKNRPDDVPLDFTFLSDAADSPTNSDQSTSDQQAASPPDAGDCSAFQPKIAGEVVADTAMSTSFPTERVQANPLSVESIPIESVPVESVPVESKTIETTPIQTMRAESVLVDSMSVESVLDDSMLDESMSFETTPDQQAPDQQAPSEPSTRITGTASPPPDSQSSAAELTASNPVVSAAAAQSFSFNRSVSAPVTELPLESKEVLNLSQRSPENPARVRAENAPPPPALAGKLSSAVLGYAASLTLIFLFCLFTGRLSLRGNHPLESLPDIRPIPSNEFRKVPDGTAVPAGHVQNLGESRRYGDVVLTPVRVTREPLTFQHFLTGKTEDFLTTEPVLKLWLKFENVADNYGFPPFDAGLMSHRAPRNAMGRGALECGRRVRLRYTQRTCGGPDQGPV